MRNQKTRDFAATINAEYAQFLKDEDNTSVNAFMDLMREKYAAYDIQESEEVETFGGHTDQYAAFHVAHDGEVLSCYWWANYDEWFCKG